MVAGETFHVLLIEDAANAARLFEESLREGESNVHVRWERSLSAALTALGEEEPDVLVVGLGLPDCGNVAAIEQCVGVADCPVVVLVGNDDREAARSALKAGAADYLQNGDLTPGLVAHRLRGVIERSQTEAGLRPQDMWMRSITENISSAIYRSTAEDGLIYVNEAFARMFGYENPKAVIEADPEGMYAHPEEREQLLRIQREKGGVDGIEVKYRRKDGSTFFGLASSSAVHSNGGVTYYDGTITDITERKEAEEALRQLKEEYETVFENAQDAMFFVEVHQTEEDQARDTPRFTFARWNATSEALTGMSKEEVRGRTPRELTDDEKVGAKIEANYRRCVQEREVLEYEEKVSFPAGTRTWHTKLSPVVVDGKVTHIVGIARDITEQKQTEREHRVLSEALEQAREAVLITEGGPLNEPGPRILYANPAFEAMTGYAEKEVLGETPRMFQGPDTEREVLDDLRDALESGRPWSGETTNYRKDGTPFVMQWNVAPVRGDTGKIEYWVSVQRDVTEERRREEELRQERNLLNSVFQTSVGAIVILDVKGEFVRANPRAKEVLSLEESEITGRAFNDPDWHITDHDGDPLPDENLPFAQVRDTGEPVFGVEHAIEWPDGTRRLLSVNGAPLRDEDGTFAGGVFLLDDVTERKQMEAELRESRERFRSLAEQTSDVITRHADDGTYLYVSPSVEPILGYTPEELIGRGPYEFVHPDDVERVQASHEAILQGEHVRTEFRHVHADGHAVWVESVGRLITDDTGSQELVLSTRPIDERKETEEKLRRSRERWQQLIESQRDAVQISVDGVIQYTNPAGVELFGAASKEELIGRRVREFIVSEAAEAQMEKRAEQIRRGIPTEPFEHEIERFDGERRIVESYAVPIQYKGKRAAQGIIRDVTERKRTQKQLQQAQKMETVGALAGGIAHDFNNILHSVSAYVQLVQEDVSESGPAQELLDRASQGLGRAESLVQKLLTFSRQEPSDQAERVDVGEVVRESIGLVQPSLPKNVTLRTDIGDGCTTEGDPGELHQVATNIITNAGQAMAESEATNQHVLDVDVRVIDVDEDLAERHLGLDPGRYVRLSISDTGSGMDEATKERIFEPFFTTKEVGEGTGLGLSVVHGIVQSLDGEIVVYSEPGEGTTFDVYLPHATEEDVASRRGGDADASTLTTDAHVLFVDDDEHITELEAVRLRRLGYEVTTCQSAPEALRTFENASGAFDVVVTDFAMPERSGLDLARELRQRGYEHPIVLMSGFSAQISLDEAQEAGVTTFLRKPVGGEELNQTLSRLLG